jgi:hypothetical protein
MLNQNLSKAFKARKGKVYALNRTPFVILADKSRTIHFAQDSFCDEATLTAKAADIK